MFQDSPMKAHMLHTTKLRQARDRLIPTIGHISRFRRMNSKERRVTRDPSLKSCSAWGVESSKDRVLLREIRSKVKILIKIAHHQRKSQEVPQMSTSKWLKHQTLMFLTFSHRAKSTLQKLRLAKTCKMTKLAQWPTSNLKFKIFSGKEICMSTWNSSLQRLRKETHHKAHLL